MIRTVVAIMIFLFAYGARLAAQGYCQTPSTQPIQFGSYSSGTIRVTGSVQVRCNVGTQYTVSLSAGLHGGSVTGRQMVRNTDGTTLGYQLFSDASYTTNWGNSAGTNWVIGTGTGDQQNITIYAEVPALEAIYPSPNGSNGNNFSDSITVSVAPYTGSSFSTASSTVLVNLQQISSGCGIMANPLAFGIYTGTALAGSTIIQVGCTMGTAYQVGLNAGTGSGATVTNRKMTLSGGTATLGYGLYSDPAHTTYWGNTVGTNTVQGVGNNYLQSLTVYGQIPAGTPPPVQGSYFDTITATITY